MYKIGVFRLSKKPTNSMLYSPKEILKYLDLSYKVSKCSDINILTKKIKDMEKYLVKYPSIEKEDELNNLISELNSIPLYQDYKDKCSELNYILSLVKDKFDNFVSDLLVNKNRL